MDDRSLMKVALTLARKASGYDELPIGAVVVNEDGMIIGKGYNRTERSRSQSRHAEVIALEKAGKKRGTWRLEGCTIYVTLEPCLMCISLICLSRVSRLVYGADSPLFGFQRDKEFLPEIYRKHLKGISSGIEKQESAALLESFFKRKRMEHE